MLDIIDNIPDGFLVSSFSRSKETQLRDSHEHNFHEIYFLVKGTARHFIENEIINMNSGEFVLIKKGDLHKTMYSPGETTERLMICFSDEFLGEEYLSIIEELGSQKYMKLSPFINLEMGELARKIYKEYQLQQYNYLDMCKCLTKELLTVFYRQTQRVQQTTLTTTEQTMQDIAKYITENYNSDISLAHLADKYAMSQGHLSRTFKSVTGFGINEYITAIRISNAEKLLKTRQFSVTEVALKCGFSDSNYFTSVFRVKKGITPRKYALMVKEDSAVK